MNVLSDYVREGSEEGFHVMNEKLRSRLGTMDDGECEMLAAFIEPELGRVVYGDWHREVEAMVKHGSLALSYAPSNRLVAFDDRTWHTGTQATQGGWRFFLRVSRYRNASGATIARRNARTNEVRRQVQVYLENPTGGW